MNYPSRAGEQEWQPIHRSIRGGVNIFTMNPYFLRFDRCHKNYLPIEMLRYRALWHEAFYSCLPSVFKKYKELKQFPAQPEARGQRRALRTRVAVNCISSSVSVPLDFF